MNQATLKLFVTNDSWRITRRRICWNLFTRRKEIRIRIEGYGLYLLGLAVKQGYRNYLWYL